MEPTIVEKDLGDLSPEERIIVSELTSNFAFFNPGRLAVLDQDFVHRFVTVMRGDGKSRAYFGFPFLVRCIKKLRECREHLENMQSAMTAILLQRYLYIPRRAGHVRKGWEFIEDFYPGEHSVRIISCLKASRNNQFPFAMYGGDEDYVADVAISDYGSSWEDFQKFWSQRLQEFQSVYGDVRGAHLFKKKSLKRLELLLEQGEEFIFRTEYFRDRLELNALRNFELMYESLSPNEPEMIAGGDEPSESEE